MLGIPVSNTQFAAIDAAVAGWATFITLLAISER
jgi:hypothetical protein